MIDNIPPIPPSLFEVLQDYKISMEGWNGEGFEHPRSTNANACLASYYAGLDVSNERIAALEEDWGGDLALLDKCTELSTILAMLRNADIDLAESQDLETRLQANKIKDQIYAAIDASMMENLQ